MEYITIGDEIKFSGDNIVLIGNNLEEEISGTIKKNGYYTYDLDLTIRHVISVTANMTIHYTGKFNSIDECKKTVSELSDYLSSKIYIGDINE
ncbi:hypothetical protein [Mycobacterium sp.]|uniref:hypothetical protein n=1 Tax=Mycobacterium sp. TaxID=1785 RepID=UPI0031D7FFE9